MDAIVLAAVVVVVVIAVVGVIAKLSPSHVIPSGHGAHASSPGATGKNHFGPVYASPSSSSTGGTVQVHGVFAAFSKLKKRQAD